MISDSTKANKRNEQMQRKKKQTNKKLHEYDMSEYFAFHAGWSE